MKTLGVIGARMGSKGLPGKNVKPIAGKPMIVYAFEAALAASSLDRLVVTTDDPAVKQLADSFGIQWLHRPPELCHDHAPLELAFRHVLLTLEKDEEYCPDLLAQIYPNVPVRRHGDIDAVIALAKETGADSVVTVYQARHHPECLKRMVDGGRLAPYEKQPTVFTRQGLEPLYTLNGSVIVTRRDVLLACTDGNVTPHGYLGEDIRAYVQEPMYSVEVDTHSDFLLAEFYLQHKDLAKIGA